MKVRIALASLATGLPLIVSPNAMADTTYTTSTGQTATVNSSSSTVVVASGTTLTISAGNSSTAYTTASTPSGTATVTSAPNNGGTVMVSPSSTGNTVTVTSSNGGISTITLTSSTASVSLNSPNTTTPLVLTGTNTTSAPISVDTGVVAVSGTLTAPSLTISSDAVMSAGGGSISNTPVTVLGALRIGGQPQLFTYSGSILDLSRAQYLQADIDGTIPATATNFAAGYYGVYGAVNGEKFVLGGAIRPTLGADAFNLVGDQLSSGYKNPPIGTGYVIMTADATSTITGAFTGIGTAGQRALGPTTQAAMLANTTFDVVYTPNSVTVYVTPTRYQDLAQSGIRLGANQTASATALQALRMAYRPLGVERLSGDLKSVFDALPAQSAGQLQTVYDQIGGAEIASLGTAAVRTSDLFTDALTQRADHNRTLAQKGLSGGDASAGKGLGAWIQPIGAIGSVSSDGNGPGYGQNTYGVLAGAETRVGDATLGLTYGFAHDDLSFDTFGNRTAADSHQVSAYGGYAFGNAFVDGTLGYTFKSYREARNIAIGSYARTASGNTNGSDLGASGTIGYTFTPLSFVIEPSLGFRYNAVHLDGFTETGAGPLNLKVGAQTYDSLRSVLSVRIARPFTLDSGETLIPEARIGWAHAVLGDTSRVSSVFTAGGGSFTVAGSKPGNDEALVGLGLKAAVTSHFDVFANYDGRISERANAHGLTAGIKYKF